MACGGTEISEDVDEPYKCNSQVSFLQAGVTKNIFELNRS